MVQSFDTRPPTARNRSGNEVDVLIDEGDKVVPLEINRADVSSDYFRARSLAAMAKNIRQALAAYGGDKAQTRLGYKVVPWPHR